MIDAIRLLIAVSSLINRLLEALILKAKKQNLEGLEDAIRQAKLATTADEKRDAARSLEKFLSAT